MDKATAIEDERQLTPEENETFQRLFPDEAALKHRTHRQGLVILDQKQICSPEYYKDLVLKCTSKEVLPWICCCDLDGDEGSISLFRFNARGELLMPMRYNSAEGRALSLFVLNRLVGVHLDIKLQHETRMIVEQKTTSSEQMKRIGSLLEEYGA